MHLAEASDAVQLCVSSCGRCGGRYVAMCLQNGAAPASATVCDCLAFVQLALPGCRKGKARRNQANSGTQPDTTLSTYWESWSTVEARGVTAPLC